MNTHTLPDTMHEVMARDADLLSPAILSSTIAAAGWAGMAIGPFATYGYVRDGSPIRLKHVNQPAAGVTFTGSDGQYWLAIHHDTHSAVVGWTRVPGSHYVWRTNPSQPADPPGGLVLAGVTIAGSAITAVDASLNYPAQKIAFGSGTGGLAFDTNLRWDGTTQRVAGTVDGKRFVVNNFAGDNAIAFQTDFMAGTNRWAIYASGTAPAFLGGELRVTGALTVLGATGLGGNAAAGYTLFTYGQSSLAANVGIGLATTPTTATLDVNGSLRVRTTAQVDGHAQHAATTTMAGQVGCGGAWDTNYSLRSWGNTYCDGTVTSQGNLLAQAGVVTGNPAGNGVIGLSGNVMTTGGSNRWNLYCGGDAPNYLAGQLGVQMAPQVGKALSVSGNAMITGQIETTGNLLAHAGVYVGNPPGNGVMGLASTVMTAGGTNRWNINCSGDAPNFLAGQLGIQVAPASNIALNISWNKGGQYGMRMRPLDTDVGAGHNIVFTRLDGTDVGSIQTTAAGTTYVTTSDVRMKADVAALTGALQVVQALRPVRFVWQVDGTPGAGFLAHEVQRVVDGVVTGEPEAVDGAGRMLPQMMDASRLVVWVVGAVQELAARLEENRDARHH